METTMSAIFSGDPTMLNIALDTFGAIASINQGRQSLLYICKEQQIHHAMKRIGEIIVTENTGTRLRALDALSDIYHDFPEETHLLTCKSNSHFSISRLRTLAN